MILDLEKTLGKAKNRIAFVGIELEGGWKSHDINLTHDASVFNRDTEFPPGFDRRQHQRGELPSTIMEPAGVPSWIKKFYPDFHNHTCGLHVHMSFRSAQHYIALMRKDYQDTMMYYLGRWGADEAKLPPDHCFWSRIAGNNQYCRLEFWPDEQVIKKKSYQHGPGDRYTAINFCWAEHKTVEVRVLPMMPDAATAVKAVRKVLDITNACLVVFKDRKHKLDEEVVLSGPSQIEEELDQLVLV